MKIGYARISTKEQELRMQLDALKRAGCEKIFKDIASGAKSERPGLAKLMEHLREGDILVVWRFDRLGRSLRHFLNLASDLEEQKVGLMSLCENIDTTTPGGKLVFHIFGALAEFERNLIRERTMAGLIAARARGKCGGRKRKMSDDQIRQALELYKNPQNSFKSISDTFGISKTTFYKRIKEYRIRQAKKMRAEGVSDYDICVALGIRKHLLHEYLLTIEEEEVD